MRAGWYGNELVDGVIKVSPQDISRFLRTKTLEEFDTVPGLYSLVEKWENPYWKKNGSVYVPGVSNPIGQHLLIFGGHAFWDEGESVYSFLAFASV